MSSARSLAIGSGLAFTSGAVAGVLGNNLAQGRIFWIGFIAFTALGTAISGWLTYRAAAPGVPAMSPNHQGSNTVKSVKSNSGPAIGISYGSAHGGARQDDRTP